MPEEINRILTDSISDLLFTTEPVAAENLAREGVAPGRVHFVGNVMIDTLFRYRERARESSILRDLGLAPGGYAALTLHRPSNVDAPEALGRMMDAIARIQAEIPVVFPVHRGRERVLRSWPGGWKVFPACADRAAALPGLRPAHGERAVCAHDSGASRRRPRLCACPASRSARIRSAPSPPPGAPTGRGCRPRRDLRCLA
jgi:hypothetical protein